MSQLIWNTRKQKLATVLAEAAQNADVIYIAVAFFTKGGWHLIKEWLLASVKRGCQVELFIGTDFYQTDPSALKAVETLLRNQPNCNLWLCKQNFQSVFHPKLYVFKTNAEVVIILGSANLTEGGLLKNHEVCCRFVTSQISDEAMEIEAIFDFYRSDRSTAKKVTLLDITAYEAAWKLYHPKVRNISKVAIAEIDALPSFDEDKLQYYLRDYHTYEAKNYKYRANRYQKAPAKLDELLEAKNKGDFLRVYEALVGKAGGRGKQLWYSGGLFRNKTAVAEGFEQACEMIKTIRNHPTASPVELFTLGLPYVKKVDGMGVNVLTEVMHTFYPERCPVLNNNSLGSLRKLNIARLPEPQSFSSIHYQQFTEVLEYLRNRCEFESMGQVDHFLNHVYHKFVKPSSKKQELS